MLINIRNALLAMVLLVPAHVQAEPLDRNILEALDTIWISDDVTASAKAGVTVAGFHIATFHDGRVTYGIGTYGNVYADRPCDDFDTCEGLTNRIEIGTANYTIDGNALLFSGLEASHVSAFRPEIPNLLRSEALAPREGKTPARLEDGALIVDLGQGPRRYLPFPNGGVDMIMGLAHGAELSLMHYGGCMVQGLHARLNVPEADRTSQDAQMLDYAAYGAVVYNRYLETQKLYALEDPSKGVMPPADALRLKRLQIMRHAASPLLYSLVNGLREGTLSEADWTVPDDDTLWNMQAEAFPVFAKLPQEDQTFYRKALRAELPMMYRAVPTIAKLTGIVSQRDEAVIRQAICP